MYAEPKLFGMPKTQWAEGVLRRIGAWSTMSSTTSEHVCIHCTNSAICPAIGSGTVEDRVKRNEGELNGALEINRERVGVWAKDVNYGRNEARAKIKMGIDGFMVDNKR